MKKNFYNNQLPVYQNPALVFQNEFEEDNSLQLNESGLLSDNAQSLEANFQISIQDIENILNEDYQQK